MDLRCGLNKAAGERGPGRVIWRPEFLRHCSGRELALTRQSQKSEGPLWYLRKNRSQGGIPARPVLGVAARGTEQCPHLS